MSAAAADKYPDHPVKVMAALPAGGGVDKIARLVGQKLSAQWGQPFVVDNRAGASGQIGLPVVAKAAPDQEGGIPNMTMVTWIGLLAPAAAPRALLDQINHRVHAILQSEDVKAQLRAAGMDVAPTTPEQFKQTIAEEIELHAELVKASGLVPQ